MISFVWSMVAALAFTISGVLLRDGEFRLSGITFVAAWAWLVFPKIPMWAIRQTGRLFHGQRKAAA
jgi:hypothetical protein